MICSFRRMTSDPELYTPIACAAETTCSSWALSTARAMSSFSCISLRPPAETPSAPAAFSTRIRMSRASNVDSSVLISRSISIRPRRNSPRARPTPRASSGSFEGPKSRSTAMMIKMTTHSMPSIWAAMSIGEKADTLSASFLLRTTGLSGFRTCPGVFDLHRRSIPDDVESEHRERDEEHRDSAAVWRDDRAEQEDGDRGEAPVFLPEVRPHNPKGRQAIHEHGKLEGEAERERE